MTSLTVLNTAEMLRMPHGGTRRPRRTVFPDKRDGNHRESSPKAKQKRSLEQEPQSGNTSDSISISTAIMNAATRQPVEHEHGALSTAVQLAAHNQDDSSQWGGKLHAQRTALCTEKQHQGRKYVLHSPKHAVGTLPPAQTAENAQEGSGSDVAKHLLRAPAKAAPCVSLQHDVHAAAASSSLVASLPSLPDRAPCSTHGTATSARSPAEAASGAFRFASQCPLPTGHGDFIMRVYVCSQSGKEAVVMLAPRLAEKLGVSLAVDPAQAAAPAPAASAGDTASPPVASEHKPLVRVHDACATSELFASLKCDCKVQLDTAMSMVLSDPAGGAVIYLQQEGRGIGLANKVAAYALQQGCGADTVDANRALGLPDDVREYAAVRDIFEDLKIGQIRLLTNNPRKVAQLEALGVSVAKRVPLLVTPPSALARGYLDTKIARMQHIG